MPSNPLSLKLTDQFRRRLDLTRQALQKEAVASWPSIETFDKTQWPQKMATLVTRAQSDAVRASAGYLSALLQLETGKRSVVTLSTAQIAGKASDGDPLTEAFQSPLIGVKMKLGEGADPRAALRYGLDRGTRQVGMYFDFAHHTAVVSTTASDKRFDGWQRATTGTCGACLALADQIHHELWFPHHPGCKCVAEPVVSGVPDSFPRPTGTKLFAAKTESEQNEAVGPDTAALLRSGAITLPELVQHEELESEQHGFVSQKPISDLAVPATSN